MSNKGPPQPTFDQCKDNSVITWTNNVGYTETGFACVTPQIGGYCSRCVVVGSDSRDEDGDQCFDLYIWHDGEFPHDGEPTRLHFCATEQLVEFAALLQSKLKVMDEGKR